jgi:DNA polymerase
MPVPRSVSSRHTSGDASPFVPAAADLGGLAEAAAGCRGCALYERATQTVFGAGAQDARVMLVGEQPGDREDREGHVFVGPAGRVLDEGLQRAGIPRDEVYLSNVVKHFRYKLRGKRRIHQTPDRWQVTACLPWVQAELAVVKPEALVLLGAVAGQALIGSSLRVGRDRGRALPSDLADLVTVTTHPSAILRQRDEAQRTDAMAAFAADLKAVADWLTSR